MNKEIGRAATRMLARANKLGLTSKSGKPLSVDVMQELLAAREGYRNAHAYKAALAKREAPSLVQELPDESGSDYKLVSGRGCWISMGPFSVHPYFTDEGVVVDVFAKGAEDESIASTWAHTNDAEDAFYSHHGLDLEQVEEWAVGQGAKTFGKASAEERMGWARRFHEASSEKAKDLYKKAPLEELGYEFSEVAGTGLWTWSAPTDDALDSFIDEQSAVDAAWYDAGIQAQSALAISAKDWEALGMAEQARLLRTLKN